MPSSDKPAGLPLEALARLKAKWAALSPEDQIRTEAAWREISATHYWDELRAAARAVGLSDREFSHALGPQELLEVIPNRARKIEQADAITAHDLSLFIPKAPTKKRGEGFSEETRRRFQMPIRELLGDGRALSNHERRVAMVKRKYSTRGQRKGTLPYERFYSRQGVTATEFTAWLNGDQRRCGAKKRSSLDKAADELPD